MWYKLVEGKLANFEILAKFLIHNLSAYIMKVKSNKGKEKQPVSGGEYSLEYEK